MSVPLPPVTVRTLLLDPAGGTDDVTLLAETLTEHGVLGSLALGPPRLADSMRSYLRSEVADIAAGLTQLDLGDLLLAGWRKRTDLLEAARRTARESGSVELVPLASHDLASTHHAAVDIAVDGFTVHTVALELTVTFHIDGLHMTVRNGRLLRVRCARATVTAGLTADGFTLARKKRAFDVGKAIHLGANGLPLERDASSKHGEQAGRSPELPHRRPRVRTLITVVRRRNTVSKR